jgi:hypothetical protein
MSAMQMQEDADFDNAKVLNEHFVFSLKETALVFFFSSPFISDNFQPKGTFTLHF